MPVRVPELTTPIDHPPPSWLWHGETRQLPERDDELAISCAARSGPTARMQASIFVIIVPKSRQHHGVGSAERSAHRWRTGVWHVQLKCGRESSPPCPLYRTGID
jgi:hypothetical protein